MALVSYTYSSDEDNTSSDEDGGGKVITINNPSNEEDIFLTLPEPKAAVGGNEQQEEDQDEFLLKKETPTEQPKPKVKITLDSLFTVSDSDDDEPQPKKSKKVKGSGLFAILPPPRSSPATAMQFIPNVLKKKAQSSQPKPSPIPKSTPKVEVATTVTEEAEDSDEDDAQMELFDDQTWKQLCGRKKRTAPPVVKVSNGHGSSAANVGQVLEELNMREVNATPEADEVKDSLDNDAFKKLVGSSKLVKPNLKLIDINEEDIMPDKDIWMTKALTDPECKPAHVIENPVNDTCRKKHHITYLAQQAKANEQELQNQWAASRHTRKQTQQKYGF